MRIMLPFKTTRPTVCMPSACSPLSSHPALCRPARCQLACKASTAPGAASSDDAAQHSQFSGLGSSLSRRSMVIKPLLLPALGLLASGPARADEEVQSFTTESAPGVIREVSPELKQLYDPILAYRFSYPSATLSSVPLSMVLARPPEKYSSAAPLTADGRQRIVAELIDLRKFVSVTMTVGPASGVLKTAPPDSWKPKEVALTVLIDRSTSRLSSGQRVALNDVEEAHLETREGGRQYWVYEHLSQGSPTSTSRSKESFRHALAVTTWRPAMDGTVFLFTLNMACPESLWKDLEPLFQESAKSFVLTEPTSDYIPPDKNPWLFF